jgi:hypothetical protein
MGRLRTQPVLFRFIILMVLVWLGAQSALPAAEASNVVELILPEATWKFLDDGSDPGTFWRFAFHNDNGWRSGQGQFGYGEGDEASHINPGAPTYAAHYFRHKFHVAHPEHFTNLLFRVLRDDGVVVYLNGTEIFRMNMPDGPVDNSTPAVIPVTIVDENTWFPTNVSAARLVQGTNIVAVELHQTPASSDASFNLSLTGMGPVQNPRLLVDRASGLALRWDNTDFGLEEKVLPAGIWSWLTNAASPYPIPAGGSRLYRLRSR